MSKTVAELLQDAKAGDAASLGQLLEAHRKYLRVLAGIEIGRRMQGKVDASDVVQDAFLDAHRYFPNFRGSEGGQFLAWLREILAGTLAYQLRRYLGTKARDIRLERGLAIDLGNSSVALAALPADPHPSPSEGAAAGEQTLWIAEALDSLPAHYRETIVLRNLEGLTFPEVAARMGRSQGSVEKLWLRAIQMLRQTKGPMP